MDATLFLTLVATIFAIYTVLPEHKKIKIISSLGCLEFVYIIIFSLIMLISLVSGIYLSLNYGTTTNSTSSVVINTSNNNLVLNQFIMPLNTIQTFFGYNIQFIFEMGYLLSALCILLLFLRLLIDQNTKIKNSEYFLDKIEELINEKKYATLSALLDNNYNILKKNQKEDNENNSYMDLWLNKSDEENNITSEEKLFNKIKNKLLINEFVKQITIFRPYFGIKIIEDDYLDIYFKQTFAELYFSNLLTINNSALYHEIANIEENRNRYKVLEENKILYTIFSQINFADDIKAYRLGDTVLKILEKQENVDSDVYNQYNRRFIDEGKYSEPYSDPVFMGIRFFDIMIKEAIFQNIESHMWVYYYHHFVRQICMNYNQEDANKDETVDFPNIYSYFLFEIIHNLVSWIKLSLNDDIQLSVDRIVCQDDSENIISSCITCLSLCIKEILNEKYDLSKDERTSLTMNVFKLYFKLIFSNKENPKKYAKILLCCIFDGSDDYLKSLLDVLMTFDTTKLRGRGGPEPRIDGVAKFNKLKSNLKEKMEKKKIEKKS